MTLISYHSRIHFACDVLEDALHAEIDAGGYRSVLIVCDAADGDGETARRVAAGVPSRVRTTTALIGPGAAPAVTARMTMADDPEAWDCIVAFGSQRAVVHAWACRRAQADASYERLPACDRRTGRAGPRRAEFIAVPGIDGLPGAVWSGAGGGTATGGADPSPPSVVICDPTLILDADEAARASAWANALGRCLEALGHAAFNPPADGMAVEGLRRLMLTGPDGGDDALVRARDLMAAGLNGAMAQQKGQGLTQAIGDALSEGSGRDVDAGAVKRILLPRMMADRVIALDAHDAVIRRIFDFDDLRALGEAMAGLLDRLPLAHRFRGLDVAETALDFVADRLEACHEIVVPPRDRLSAMLRELY